MEQGLAAVVATLSIAMLAAPNTGSSQRLAIFAIAGEFDVIHIMAMIKSQFAWQVFLEMNFENL